MTKNIKNTFYDALYFASSTQTKNENFHISKLDMTTLIKLIHYDSSNEKITYSDLVIAEHLFSSPREVNKSIQRLKKAGFINTINSIISGGQGVIAKRRIIKIQWNEIQLINDSIPNNKKEETKGVMPIILTGETVNGLNVAKHIEENKDVFELEYEEGVTTCSDLEADLNKVEKEKPQQPIDIDEEQVSNDSVAQEDLRRYLNNNYSGELAYRRIEAKDKIRFKTITTYQEVDSYFKSFSYS